MRKANVVQVPENCDDLQIILTHACTLPLDLLDGKAIQGDAMSQCTSTFVTQSSLAHAGHASSTGHKAHLCATDQRLVQTKAD